MGVKGLWSLLNPVGRPVQIESLEGKRLAIDSSIWLYQFQSTMRDKEGRVLVNAHVLGFLRRINKLLFHGIKPVFVFDGGAPALKRSTIAERKRRKAGAAFNHAKMAEKLLAAQMRREAVRVAQEAEAARNARMAADQYQSTGGEMIPENAVYLDQLEGRAAPPAPTDNVAASSSSVNPENETPEQRRKRFKKWDRYYLPEAEMPTTSTEDRPDARLATEEELKQFIDEMRPEDLDVDSEEFRALPTEVQYEIIGDLRVKSRQQSHKRLTDMLRAAPTALDFSKAQIKHLSQRNSLTQQLLTVTDMVSKAHLTIPVKIAAERNREYVLVKKNENEGGGWALGIREGTREKPIVLEPETPEKKRPVKREASSDDDSDSDIEEVGEYRPPPDDDLRKHRRQEVLDAIARRYAPAPKKEEKVASFGKAREPGAAPLFDVDEDFEFEVEGATEPEPVVDVTANDEALALALQQEELGSDEETADPALARALALSRVERNSKTPPAPAEAATAAEDSDSDEFEEVDVTPSAGATPEPIVVESDDDDIEVTGTTTAAPAPQQQKQPLNDPGMINSLVKDSLQGNAALSSKTSSSRKPGDLIRNIAQAASSKYDAPSRPADQPVPAHRPQAATGSWQAAAIQRSAAQSRPEAARAEPRPSRPKKSSAAQLVAAAKPPPQREPSEQPSESEDEFEEISVEPSKEPSPAPLRQPSPLEERTPSPARGPTPSPPRTDNLTPDQEVFAGRGAPSPSPVPITEETPARISTRQAPSPSPLRETPPAPEEGLRAHEAEAGAVEAEPPLVDTLQEESEDEEAIEWSRSPSPVRRKVGVAPEEGDTSFQSVDSTQSRAPSQAGGDQGEIDNGEMAPVDMVDEEDDYARFLAQIKGRDLTDVRTEIDEEIRVLNTQTKAAMRDSDEITQAMVMQIQTLLRHFGIPYITAPMEAEAQCAKLAELNLVDGIITDDSDVFLFGGTQCFKNIFNDNKFAECILSTDVERELSLTRERLISLSYLLGSDYTIGLPGVGPVLALELLANFPGPDGLLKFKEWWVRVQRGQDSEDEADTKWKKSFKKRFAGSIFLLTDWPNPQVREAYLYPTTDESEEPFHWGFPRLQALRTFLHEELSWSISKVDDELTPIVQRIALRGKGALSKQKTLLPFFDATAGVGHYAPRRRQVNVSKRLLNVIKEFREAEARARGEEPEELGEMIRTVEPVRTGKRKVSAPKAVVAEGEEAEEPLEEVQPKKRKTRAATSKRGGRGGRGGRKSARSSRSASKAASTAASDDEYAE